MKGKRVWQGVAFASILAFGMLTPTMFKVKEALEPDNAIYDQPRTVDYDKPDYEYKAKPAAVVSATSVEIHYHNDGKDCHEREFWVWCNGVNGSAFAPTEVSDDHKDMTLAFSFTGEHANFANKKGLYFIVKKIGTWTGQSENIYLDYSVYVPDSGGKSVVWCIPGEGNQIELYPTKELTEMDRFQSATFKDWKSIDVIATAVPSTYKLYALTSNYMANQMLIGEEGLDRYLIAEGSNPTCTDVTYNSLQSKKFTINLNYTARVNVQYYLVGKFPKYLDYQKTKYVSFHSLYETKRFKQYYTYDGNDLGAVATGEKTTFTVWAPTAAYMRLMLFDHGTSLDYAEEHPNIELQATDDYRGYDMAFLPGGIWQVTINKSLHAKYYKYLVYNSLGMSEVVDPYAKSCGVNGERGAIINFTYTNPSGWNNVPDKWDGQDGYDIAYPNDLSIYETHIRDLTMDETWTGNSMPGTYTAFAEEDTTYGEGTSLVKTGFDHIEELGVKAVQLEPVFDSDNLEGTDERSYNWGYNPVNYNVVDGSYATNPYKGEARVKEFKELVTKYANNENHTRIIMDVVYNHVSSAPSSCFNKLMPRYYFRMTENGDYYDGSGCGNEVKTEAPMMSKYIVDSLCFWAKEYKIKGFRFDLMGLIDWQTVKKAAQELYKIDPDIYLYGEGWSADGTSGNMENHEEGDPYYGNWGSDTWTVYNKLQKDGNMCFVGTFNNAGRDAFAGETGKIEEWGFIDQGSSDVGEKSYKIADLLVGYHSGQERVDPNQCINYASCHDDFALFDHLLYSMKATGSDQYTALACAATAAVEDAIMFSNGVAFIRGGEETFQSKHVSAEDLALYGYERTAKIGDEYISSNSYRLSDYTNAMRWDRKISIGSVQTKQYYDAIKDAVHARDNLPKYNKQQLDEHVPWDSGSPMNFWNRGDGSTVIGMKNNDYFFFIAGCNDDNIPFSAINSYQVEVFNSNPAYNWKSHSGTNYLKLGWYMCVCVTR